MAEIFGDFAEIGECLEFLIISFSSSTIPIQDRWRNNSLSADFLADYWGTFFPVRNKSSRSEVQDIVNYIANELLENAVKFNWEESKHPIRIALYLTEDVLRFYVSNGIDPQTVSPFQNFIQELLTKDTDELYIRQLESNAGEEESDESCLGFLTMINDYDARLAWKFETMQDPEAVIVTTMVELAIVRTHEH